MLTYDEAHRLFVYDPETGSLKWRVSNGRRAVAGCEAGSTHSYGYRHVIYMRSQYKAHRIILLMVNGEWPDGHVDHANGDKSDNRLCNLRIVTMSENSKNLPIRMDNNSGVMGVCWRKDNLKWRSFINSAGNRKVHLGCFDSLLDAVAARKSAELALGFHENHGRKACR